MTGDCYDMENFHLSYPLPLTSVNGLKASTPVALAIKIITVIK